jgi:hypothetical protein
MSDPPGVTTERRRPVWSAIVVIVVAAIAVFVVVYRGDDLRRRSAAQLARQAEVSRELQQPPASTAAWVAVREVPLGLQEPVGLALTPQALYVAGNNVVRIFADNYQYRRDVRLAAAPTCIAATDTALVVGFRDRVSVYDPSGVLLAEWPVLSSRSYFTSLVVWRGEVWIGDSGMRLVWRFTDDGQLIGTAGGADRNKHYSGLIVTSPHLDLALSPQGHMLVANPGKLRVEVWDRGGQLLRQFGRPATDLDGFCGCCNPIAVAALPDGRIVTAEKGIVRVKVYRADGTFEGLVAAAPPLSRGGNALDLATTAAGQIVVLDPRGRMIRVFEELSKQSSAPRDTAESEHAD